MRNLWSRHIAVGNTISISFPLFNFNKAIEVHGRLLRRDPDGYMVVFDKPINELKGKNGNFPEIVHEIIPSPAGQKKYKHQIFFFDKDCFGRLDDLDDKIHTKFFTATGLDIERSTLFFKISLINQNLIFYRFDLINKKLNFCLKRILQTTPFYRFKLALIPLLIVDLILVPISIFGGSPSLQGVIKVNGLVILILLLRFTALFFWRLRCKACGKGWAKDTGKNDYGYPVVKCSQCGREWIL